MTQSATNPAQTASAGEMSKLDSETAAMTKGITRALDAVADSEASEDRAIKLGLFWDEWARCVGSGYQWDSLYRYGRLDSCGKQWKDLKLAIEARLIQWRNPSRAKELIDSTYYKKRTTISPTAGAIWELKEKPGWN